MRSDQPLRLALVAIGLLAFASTAAAQSAWEAPAQTFPPSNPRPPIQSRIVLWSSPALVVGASYAIETFNLSAGDPVMTITTQSEPTSTVITGADGLSACYPSNTSLSNACATFTATTTSPVWAHIRAWRTNTGGAMSLRIRRLSGAVPTDNAVCPAGTTVPTTTCWIQDWGVANQTFGGVVREGLGATATRYHLVTRETPYYQASALHALHALWFVASNDASESWRIRTARIGLPANGVGQTTSYNGPLPSGIASAATAVVVAGSYGTDSDVILQRNDFVPGSPAVGTDFDSDGLGAELEALLRTCDSPTTASPAGFTCNLRGCTTGMTTPTAACKTSLNDSDRDGIPDPVDLYGGVSNINSRLRLARMGTSPAQFDVLLETDVGWDDTFLQGGGCTYTDAGAIDWREALQAANIYQNSSTFVTNRNGTQGIHLHTEIPGLAPSSILGFPTGPTPGFGDGAVSFPYLQDPRWHYSGADSTCARPPACVPPAGGATDPCIALTGGGCTVTARACVLNRATPCTTNADCTAPGDSCVDPDDVCTVPDQRGYYMSAARRLLFRYNLSFASRGGSGAIGGMQSAAGDIEWAHELGHQGGLGHSGPGPDDSANGRPNHYSHMNYLFQNYGLVSTVRTMGVPNTLDLARLRLISFANGTVPVLDPLAVPEVCPLGTSVSYQPLYDNGNDGVTEWNTGTNHEWNVTPNPPGAVCPAVDWERDGDTYSSGAVPAGQTLTAGLWAADKERTRRASFLDLGDNPCDPNAPGDCTGVTLPAALSIDQPADLVRLGATNVCAYRLVRYPQTGAALERSCNGVWSCPSAAVPGITRFPNCNLGVPPDNSGAILLENLGPTPVLPNGAFAVETTTRGDGLQVAVVVWRVGATEIRMGVDTAAASLSNVQTLAGTTIAPFATTAASDGTQLLALSRIGDGQSLSLVYRSNAGTLVEHTMTWSGTTPVWTSTPVALPVPTQFTGSPGSVRLPSSTFTITPGGVAVGPGVILGITRTPSGGGSPPPQLELWVRSSGLPSGSWVLTATSPMVGLASATAFRGQPQLAISPIRRGTAPGTLQNHLWTAATTMPGMLTRILRSTPGVIQSAPGTAWLQLDGDTDWATSSTPPMLRDDRQPAGLRGIIAHVRSDDTCPNADNPCLPDEVCTALAPSLSVCAIAGGRFIRSREYQSVGMDGVVPGILESFNEWPQLQYSFCSGVRAQRPYAPSPWGFEPGDSCIDAPVY